MAVEEPREVIVEREPVREREPRSSVGTIIAVIVGVLILLALLIYGLPYITGNNSSSTNVNTPTPAVSPTNGG